jgi:hypothetical protein
MRTFFGMVLGCLLTIAVVYVHDTAVTPVVGGQAGTTNMIVNWDVAARRWGDIRQTIHTAWVKLQGSNARS